MAEEYSIIQHFESKQLSYDLLTNPTEFYMQNRRYAASVILQITYGRRIPIWNCDEIRRIFAVLSRFVQVRRPGAWLVDVFPALAENWVFNMISKWKEVGKGFHDADDETWMGFWREMKEEVDDGVVRHCFGRILLREYEGLGLSESQAAWIW